jgi:hypothetical protein
MRLLFAGLLLLGLSPVFGDEKPKGLTYHIVEESRSRGGFSAKVIVVDPSLRNEKDMRALGEKFKADTINDPNGMVLNVFDDEKAAEMVKDFTLFRLNRNKAELEYLHKHWVGQYYRSSGPLFHEFEITLDGWGGKMIKVKY